MRVHHVLLLVPLLALNVAGVAPPVTTYTPPIRSSDGNNFGCTAQNLSGLPVQVQADVNDGLGHVVTSGTLTIPPGEALQLAFTQTPVFGGFCSFTFAADPAAVRGVVTLEKAGGSDTQLIYPARGFADTGPQVPTFLATPPLRSSDHNNFDCVAQNLSAAPVQVINQINDGLGNIVGSQTLTVPPGEALQLAFTTQEVFGAFCTFQFQARADEVRGFATREDAGGSDTRLLVEATPTVSPLPGCCGDCNGDGVVNVNEIIIAVNHALTFCPAAIAERAAVSRDDAATPAR
jgi:hypothetical protein